MTEVSAEPDRRRLALYRALAARWDQVGVNYGIVSGLTPFDPPCLGRDLDVLVEGRRLDRAVESTIAVLTDHDWLPVVKKRPWTTLITGIADFHDEPYSVEIDLFSSQRWFNVRLVDGPLGTPDGTADGALRFDKWGTFAKQVLLQVLGGDTARLEREPGRLTIDPASETVLLNRLTRLLGDSLGKSTLKAVQSRDFRWLEANQTRLRRVMAARALLRRPVLTLSDSFAWVRDELTDRFLADRAVPIVAVVGPDGIGKTSALQELERILESRFRFEGIDVHHWRPGVLPPLQRIKQPRSRLDQSGTSPPRREGGRFSSLRLLYYSADFLLGHVLRDRRRASQLVPVLYDRCLLDMAVDPHRYGLRSGRGVRQLWRLLPGPDLVIFIDDEVARIRARKPELPDDELLRQLAMWREFASSGLVSHVVSAGDSPRETAARILPLVLDSFVSLDSRS